jgi:hypothetical protein
MSGMIFIYMLDALVCVNFIMTSDLELAITKDGLFLSL